MRRPIVALVTSLAILALAPRPAAAVPVVASQVMFMQFNYCGTADNVLCKLSNGDINNGAYNPALASRIQSERPSVVTINEICWTQLVALKADLADNLNPWTMNSAFQERGQDPDCDGIDKGFGIAILTQKTWSGFLTHPKAFCVTTTVGGTGSFAVPLAACVTHLTAGGNAAELEVRPVVDFAKAYASGKALFLGGDFNMKPDNAALDYVYASSGGNFEEMDECCNRVTHITQQGNHKKDDYMFFKKAYARSATPQPPVDVAASDHHIYYGRIDICSTNEC
jgi:hypothetical protein